MEKRSRFAVIITVILIGRIMLDFTGCTHDNQALDEYIGGNSYSETELVSEKVTTPPTIDGTIDDMWNEVVPLKTRVVVPNQLGPDNVPANFYGYGGKSYNVSLRSLYDETNIYLLVEWDDNTHSVDRETWYFDPVDSRWKKESRYPTFNSDGVLIRQAFYEDKLAFLWNVNNSVAGWNASTCYASCHTGKSASDGYSRHHTNGANERIDMWHWKLVREGVFGTVDDQYQDDAQPNGRKSDPKTAGSGYGNNSKSLTITGTSTTVNVPKYIIPGRTYYHVITQSEVNAGTAKEVTAVDTTGILTLSDNTTVDPNTDTNFQRSGSRSGSKGVPSIVASQTLGNGGDITGKWQFTGSGYIIEISRKLNTGDTENVDINFTDLSDQFFGVAVFENAAVAHAIKPNLLLKFKK